MIYYTMTQNTYQFRFYNQLQSVTVFSELKNTSLNNFHCRCQLGNKDSKYKFKQNILNFPYLLWYNFSKDEMFEEQTLSSKNTAEFKDFTMPKFSSSGFFFKSDIVFKKISQKQSTVIYSRILCNIV